MKQTRLQPTTRKNKQKSPKGLYFLALFLLIAVFSAGFINNQKDALKEEIDHSISMESIQETEKIPEEVPYIPDYTEVTMPVLPEVPAYEEVKPEEEPEPETAPVSVTDIKLTLPVSGSITKDYATDKLLYNETLRDWRTHAALDIGAEQGTSVKAAAAGTVESIYDDPLFGTTLVLRHSDTLVTKYSSLQPSLPVSTGNFVEAGEPVGNVGITATAERSDGPHLHFEILENGKSVNPKDLF